MYIKTKDRHGNKVNEPLFVETPRNPEERRSFPLSYWRKSALDRVQLPNGQSVAVDLPLSVLQDKNRPERMDWTDFEHIKNMKPSAMQTLTTACPTCDGTGYVGDADVGDVELCPLCQGVGKIVSHFGAEVVKFMTWLDNPPRAIDEKGIKRMNAENAIKREYRSRKQEALKKIPGAGNLDALRMQAMVKAERDVLVKASEAAKRIDEEMEAAIAALDEKA